MQYKAKETSVMLKHANRKVGIDRPLFNGYVTPRLWVFEFTVNGIGYRVEGVNGADVFSKTSSILRTNNQAYTPYDIWLNLNIYWYENNTQKSLESVFLQDLLGIATNDPDAQSVIRLSERSHPPMQWGSVAWKWLGLLLANDTFHKETFIHACGLVSDMLDPAKSPVTGCRECYNEWRYNLAAIRNTPPNNVQQARDWLWRVHNAVNARIGKPTLTFEQASEQNLWN